MPSPGGPAPAGESADRQADPRRAMAGRRVGRSLWRARLRALHRDVGYTAVGLTFVYGVSGLAVNHVGSWDPNFANTTTIRDLGALHAADDDAAVEQQVLGVLGIHEVPRESYREGDELEILFEHRTLHVTPATGHVVDEAQRPRFFVRAANWLHLNRGKRAWTWFADSYAVGLLFLATSGLFMISGKRGFFGRGIFFVAAGIAIPVAYLVIAGR